jgi:hypothetical protein
MLLRSHDRSDSSPPTSAEQATKSERLCTQIPSCWRTLRHAPSQPQSGQPTEESSFVSCETSCQVPGPSHTLYVDLLASPYRVNGCLEAVCEACSLIKESDEMIAEGLVAAGIIQGCLISQSRFSIQHQHLKVYHPTQTKFEVEPSKQT